MSQVGSRLKVEELPAVPRVAGDGGNSVAQCGGRVCGAPMFRRLGGFAVSHPLAWKLTFTIGSLLYEREMAKAESLWLDRTENPERFEPTPHQLRSRERAQRLYVMMDNSKIGMQEGKRGRKAPKRKKASKKKGVSDGAEGWRDARALIVFRDIDMATNHSGKRRSLLKAWEPLLAKFWGMVSQ